MFEILMALTLGTSSAYAADSLHVFGALASERVVDGIPYSDGDGVISAGGTYAHPSGFFLGTELLAFSGHGRTLPDGRILALDSFAGWQTDIRGHRVALQLLDYRVASNSRNTLRNGGIGLSYRYRQIHAEYAYEADKAYYAAYSDVFHRYNVQRGALAWRQPVGINASWTMAVGGQQLDWQDVRHEYLSASLQWHWQKLDWHVGVIHSSGDFQRLTGDESPTRIVLRLAGSFQLL